jgi:acyl-coenzyme A thioesterase PaaI-like protein
MSKAVMARHCEALTAELRVRFRRPVSPGDAVQIRGWVVEKRKRRILAEAMLTTAAGEEYAHAWATFLVLSGACTQ